MAKRIERELPCHLTEDEKSERAHDLALNVAEYNKIDDERKASAQEFNDKLKKLDTDQRKLARIVETGLEDRTVVCEWRYNTPRRGQKTLVRLDTHDDVQTDAMNIYDEEAAAAERQGRLFKDLN